MTTRITFKGKSRNVPKRYVPDTLSKEDRKKQVKSLIEGKDRPKLDSARGRRSSHVAAFEKKYGFKITSKQVNNIISKEGQRQILAKGRAAYYTGGSRPNQTPSSWAYARLASVIMGGKARNVDRKIWEKYKK